MEEVVDAAANVGKPAESHGYFLENPMSDVAQETETIRNGKNAVGAVKETASAAIDAATRKAAEVAGRMKDAGNRAAGYVQDQYESLSEHAHDAYASAKNKAYDWEQSAEDYVKSRPMQSLLIAAGVGAILALLWRRRD
jgi:ElaB/YqjD/DUF883 family membrane-anchored ribosome-binding protein